MHCSPIQRHGALCSWCVKEFKANRASGGEGEEPSYCSSISRMFVMVCLLDRCSTLASHSSVAFPLPHSISFVLVEGQRQLICIARAIVRKSKLVCVDEATCTVSPIQEDEHDVTTCAPCSDGAAPTLPGSDEMGVTCLLPSRTTFLCNALLFRAVSSRTISSSPHSRVSHAAGVDRIESRAAVPGQYTLVSLCVLST